jgi:dCMP deaminase
MSQETWDRYFVQMARLVATKSKDRSFKVGCVLVGEDHEVLSTGYNGMARGVDDSVGARHTRPDKYLWFEHGERNAVYNAARVGTSTRGATAYLNCGTPCSACARAFIQAGVVRVVLDPEATKPCGGFWEELCRVGGRMLAEAGVVVEVCP